MKARKRDESSFGYRLMKARVDRGMSQREVIERLMEDVRTANAWLRVRFAVTVESKRVTGIELLF